MFERQKSRVVERLEGIVLDVEPWDNYYIFRIETQPGTQPDQFEYKRPGPARKKIAKQLVNAYRGRRVRCSRIAREEARETPFGTVYHVTAQRFYLMTGDDIVPTYSYDCI